MLKTIQRSGWLAGSLILFLPITLVFFFASQMAYSQVNSRFEADQAIPEVTDLSALNTVESGQIIILRGEISDATPRNEAGAVDPKMIIFQERPADRAVRFQEEFPLTFPSFMMTISGRTIPIIPSDTREQVIQDEPHAVADGDRIQTGFRIGDTVSVQGEWQIQPTTALIDVTGLTSTSRVDQIAEWQQSFRIVQWVRNGLGLLSLISLVVFIVQLRRPKIKTDFVSNDLQTQKV